MTRRSYEGVGDAPRADEGGMRRLARAVNGALMGKINAITDVTLTANATTTTLNDRRIGPDSYIDLQPQTASAAALSPQPYASSRGQYTATITHPSSSASDLTFVTLIVG